MVQSFFDHHGVSPNQVDEYGVFDPILGIDTRLFIDPGLLATCPIAEFRESADRVGAHFTDVLRVVAKIGEPKDRMWRAADELLTFPEVQGLCIGYGASGGPGSGMGPKLRAKLLQTVWEIVRAGVSDPAVFELVGAFESDIGPDRISDMLAKIILPDLVAFTQRICSDLGIAMESTFLTKRHPAEDMPVNPITGKPVILVPRSMLRDLPIAENFGDVAWIAAHNEKLRDSINALIGERWSKVTTTEKKRAARATVIAHPEMLEALIEAYRKCVAETYDFSDDPAGEVIWYRASRAIANEVPLKLSLPAQPALEDVLSVVGDICEHFRQLIEDNQLCALLYDKSGYRKHESAAQLLFFGVASAYCTANGLDLSPESDAGRGPVDFKVSGGFDGKVLVEIKLTSNSQLQHGLEIQLPTYMRAEGTVRAIYLVIDNGGATVKRMMKFREMVTKASLLSTAIRVIEVDGVQKPSASKAHE